MKLYIRANQGTEFLEDSRFDKWQLYEIRKGFESGVDVSIYADPKYDSIRMGEIRRGLEAGLDVSMYADPKYEWDQVMEIREGLKSGVDVSVYADRRYTSRQMGEIREGLEAGIDVSLYANPKYTWEQMNEIRLGLENGIDASVYADPKYGWKQMAEIRKGLESGNGLTYPGSAVSSDDWEDIRQLDGYELYDNDSDAVYTLLNIASDVEGDCGIWAEPSVQGGTGGIWFYSLDDDSTVISGYDYETWCDDIAGLARDSSNESEFREKLERYYENLIEQYGVDEEDDDSY